nr:acetyl-CoA carboxylase biotin carboxyl carrier protein subunit [Xenorhabdus hominickii]
MVKLGEEVAEGQPLIIVEAMKMELAIHAPQSGRDHTHQLPARTSRQPR